MAKSVNKYLRLSPELANELEIQATKNTRTIQGEIIHRLKQSFIPAEYLSEESVIELRQLVDDVVNAMVADSWKGSQPIEDHDAIDADTLSAVNALNHFISSRRMCKGS